MEKWVFGKKLGMTQIWDEAGVLVPVSVIEVRNVEIVSKAVPHPSKEGVAGVIVRFPTVGSRLQLKTLWGVEGLDTNTLRFGVDQFVVGDFVKVSGRSIGRGFTGTIKRHNFSRGPMAHGSKSHRIPGSIGAGTSPSRVVKGKKMAGRYGGTLVSIRGLKVLKIDVENGLVFIKGAVPGKSGFMVNVVGVSK